MGLFDKFMDVMRLNSDDDDDDFYDDDYYDDEEEEKPKKKLFHKHEEEDDDFDEPVVKEKPKAVSKITPMRSSRKQNGNMAVCVMKPTSFEDAREITETLLMNRTVVLNVEGLDVEIAQRIIDFTSGSCYAINGNLQKISNYIFIIHRNLLIFQVTSRRFQTASPVRPFRQIFVNSITIKIYDVI